ncbi:GNAT family N-acetyltransferase [Streptomyces sp. BHT-5-2]|uniref:GNAT family N-acetyltransferase n=1 Tax=unclassified Streptomyces TaxID=2593676 RepID=UPI001C8D862E|nr:GNAT family N-acetyltransferase [Streptomyces sp. BHT-5-2]QZL01937.1 GNAT family N-acetyltransferase [Streptomyces sp. BHT-5-2]
MAPQLSAPTVRVHDSFLAAMTEFRAEGVHRSPYSGLGRELRTWHTRWRSAEGFAAYVREIEGVGTDERPDGPVPMTTFWWVDGTEYLGRITVRHRLTPSLREFGGHIGYAVRPTGRRRGHATAMLRAVLPHAHRLGIDPVLVTCDETNTGSRRVIEECGGVFEDRRAEKLRYWISA